MRRMNRTLDLRDDCIFVEIALVDPTLLPLTTQCFAPKHYLKLSPARIFF